MNKFTKASSFGKQINLFLSNKFPLIVLYKIGELGFLKFYLNPYDLILIKFIIMDIPLQFSFKNIKNVLKIV